MIVLHGDAYVEEETGEVVGHLHTHKLLDDNTLEARFSVHDEASAEWLIKKCSEYDAEILMLAEREKAIIENIVAMKKRAENKREWLTRRYCLEFAEWLKTYCEKNRTKSFATPYGTARFQKVQAALSVAPGKEEEALEWCHECVPTAVKATEKILVTPIKEYRAQGNLLPMGLFDTRPESERLAIVTGVGKDKD